MELSKNDFTMFVANYEDKASNIKNISKSLNLGLDSFIFVDDSKIECELVSQKLPEVMVINLNNQDPSNFVEIVESTHPFYFKNITKEDLDRVKSYKQISLLNDKSKSISDLEKFLRELKPQISIKKVDKDSNDRCAQLFAKTNQFKFNSNIFSSKQLLSKNFTSLSINFKDKFHN
jgi:FkbH-like protein